MHAMNHRRGGFAPAEHDDLFDDDFLPSGWIEVPSSSNPGTFVYKNIYTDEKISWWPREPASQHPGE